MSEVTKVRERPILFSAPMVRAILEWRKTQTRRIIKCTGEHKGEMPKPASGRLVLWNGAAWDGDILKRAKSREKHSYVPLAKCPYGEAGDRLWVRETWAPSFKAPKCQVAYRADGRCYGVGHDGSGGYMRVFHGWLIDAAARNGANGNTLGRGMYDRWKPSIHMPRWASRINLEITAVRCERLQDISEDDAIAEGACTRTYRDGRGVESSRLDFARRWKEINGAGSWERNEYVWAITFKVSPATSDGAEAAK